MKTMKYMTALTTMTILLIFSVAVLCYMLGKPLLAQSGHKLAVSGVSLKHTHKQQEKRFVAAPVSHPSLHKGDNVVEWVSTLTQLVITQCLEGYDAFSSHMRTVPSLSELTEAQGVVAYQAALATCAPVKRPKYDDESHRAQVWDVAVY